MTSAPEAPSSWEEQWRQRHTDAEGNPPSTPTQIAAQRIKSFVERIESLEAERSRLQQDMREVYAEAKGEGFDKKVLRKVIARRKRSEQELREEEELMELYEEALREAGL